MLIPLPFVTALVCAILALRLMWTAALPRQSRIMFALLFTCTTIGSFLVGLRFGYGVEDYIWLQRLMPLFIGPTMYLGFAAMQGPLSRRQVLIHLGLATILASTLSVTGLLDVAIALSYASYWVLIWRQYRRGGEGRAALPVGITDQMSFWFAGGLALLAAIFVLENAIAFAFIFGVESWVAPLITYASLPMIAVQFWALLNVPTGEIANSSTIDENALGDIDAFLSETHLYRDPELSLARLARRLGQPVKNVSRVINGATGASVSHYINGWRIEEAAELLRTSQRKVDDISQACGFLSRSNFYREFQRIHGQSPANFRKQMKNKA